MAEQILSLSTTKFERKTVIIDDVPYQLRAPEELTVAMQREILKAAEVPEGEEGTAADSLESSDERLSRQANLVLIGVPGEVMAKLSPVQKGQILRVFTQGVTAALSVEETTKPSSPSRGASASTAAH